MMKKFIYRYNVMSTPCELQLYTHSKIVADNAAKDIMKMSKELEKKYSYYDANSFLSKINNREISSLDNETKNILQRSKAYFTKTDGLFDITVATLKDLYRFEKDEDLFMKKKNELEAYVGCDHFKISRSKIVFDNPYTKIDLGGFVKEYSVDKAVKILKKHKIFSALINHGGDIFALGKKPDGKRFTIGIKDPFSLDKFALELEIEDEALTTSASYERNYTIGSKKHSHIIPSVKNLHYANSVTVISHNCVESGVYSTSLMLDKDLIVEHKKVIL